MKNYDYSLLSYIRSLADKTEPSAAAMQAIRETRERYGGKPNTGGGIIPFSTRSIDSESNLTQRKNLIQRLRDHSMIARLGARFYTGLIQSMDLIDESQLPEAHWLDETGSFPVDTSDYPQWAKRLVNPQRIQALVPVSVELLRSTGEDSENYFSDMLMRSFSKALDNALINGLGSGSHQPTGILNNGNITTNTTAAAPSWDHVLEAEEKAAKNYYDSDELRYAYLMHAELKRTLKKTLINTGEDNVIMAGNRLNGYPAFTTEHMPTNLDSDKTALIFGNFYDLAVMQWGALDLLVDSFTQSRKGKILLYLTGYFNIKCLNVSNFHITKNIVI